MKKIPFYTFCYSWRHYLTHPWKWFKDLWIGAKNFLHRARYGWSWVDLWNMDTYLGELVPTMLEELASRSCGAPFGDFEGSRWIEFEDWQAELRVLASLMRLAKLGTDLTNENAFEREFWKWRDERLLEPIKECKFYWEYTLSDLAMAKIDYAEDKYTRRNEMRRAVLDVVWHGIQATFDSWWD